MLTDSDLQKIKKLIDTSVSTSIFASEARTDEKFRELRMDFSDQLTTAFTTLDKKMDARFRSLENRMDTYHEATLSLILSLQKQLNAHLIYDHGKTLSEN